jgi:hypothetical protein
MHKNETKNTELMEILQRLHKTVVPGVVGPFTYPASCPHRLVHRSSRPQPLFTPPVSVHDHVLVSADSLSDSLPSSLPESLYSAQFTARPTLDSPSFTDPFNSRTAQCIPQHTRVFRLFTVVFTVPCRSHC